MFPTRSVVLAVALVACGGGSSANGDGHAGSDTGSGMQPDASTTFGSTFRFAIVGDTRPANEDDTTHYPTTIIDAIWTDVTAASPLPDFAIGTGDYQFSSPTGTQSGPQLDLYLAARNKFPNVVYSAMGNHECTGYTDSNCGSGNADGITNNYTAFMTKMLAPLGITTPYYVIKFSAKDNSWTAKLVVIAANAWNSTQASWLDTTLAQQTTYTFVVRHEDHYANTAPGVTPSETIIANHPYTLKIVGHTHTYAHYASEHEVICGNGGAPLTSGLDYGYALIDRLADGTLQFSEYDYATNAVTDTFKINADGSPAN